MNKALYVVLILFFSCGKERAKIESTTVKIIASEIDFGNISLTDTIMRTFQVKNITSVPLKIDSIGVSCGCTTVKYPKNRVLKGEIADIEIQFIPEKKRNN